MRTRTGTLLPSLLAATALAGFTPSAQAGCVPGVNTDSNTFNTCVGTGALAANQPAGHENTAAGYQALKSNTAGYSNSAVGAYALQSNTTGTGNTALGEAAMAKNTTGTGNTATGNAAMLSNTVGRYNTADGAGALAANTTGDSNTAIGQGALSAGIDASNNTALGAGAMGFTRNGKNNVAIGKDTAKYAEGSNNIAIGNRAGSDWTTGSNNISIASTGSYADMGTIRIGVEGKQTKTFVAGILGITIAGGAPVLINGNGQLGMATSSRRFKEDIHPMGDASNALMQLRPVTFRYKQADASGERPVQYGLIAEEVEQVMPELVVRDSSGTIETVAYQVLPSLLLNEYQKQNRSLADAEARLAQDERKMDAMKAELAAMKLLLEKFASASPGTTTLAAVRAEETAILK